MYKLNTSLQSQQITLNSTNADTYNNGSYKSNVTFQLVSNIQVPDSVSILCSVVSCNIPISFFIINSTNNYLFTGTRSIYIASGNYTASTFVTYMNNLNNGYTWSFNTTTNKFTITGSALDFYIYGTCLDLIGFAGGEYSSSFTLTSTYVCNFSGSLYLTIESQLTTKNIDSSTGAYSNILATIPINEANGGVVLYENKNNYKTYLSEKLISFLEIKIYDSNRNFVDFNNKDWFILLQFDFINNLSLPPVPKTIADIPIDTYDPDNPVPKNDTKKDVVPLNTEVPNPEYQLQPITSKFVNFNGFDDATTNDNFIKQGHIE